MTRFFIHSIQIIIIALFCSTIMMAQSSKIDTMIYEFESLDVTHGLPAGMIWNVEADNQGLLWITTGQGLVSYDGSRLRSFSYHKDHKYGIPNKEYINIFIDSYDLIWLSTFDLSVCVFDKKSERFFDLGKVGHPMNESENGDIWINNNETVLTYDRETIQNVILANPNEAKQLFEKNGKSLPFADETIRNVIDFRGNKYWIQGNSIIRYESNLKLQKLPLKDFLGASAKAKTSHLLHDERNGKLYLFNGNTICDITYWKEKNIVKYSLPETVKSASPWLIDMYGNLWLTERSAVVCKFSFKDKKLTRYFAKSGISSSFKGLQTRRLKLDKTGNIWIPTNGKGLKKIGGNRFKFNYFGDNHEGPIVGDIRTTRSGILYWGRNEIEIFDTQRKKQIGSFHVLNKIKCEDARTNLFFDDKEQIFEVYYLCKGSAEMGKIVYDKNGQYLKSIPLDKTEQKFQPFINPRLQSSSYTITKKKSNPTGSTEEIWEIYSNQDNAFISQIEDKNQIQISRVYESSTDLWLWNPDKGIYRYNLSLDEWFCYNTLAEKKYSLPTNRIYNIIEDKSPEKIIWVTTALGLVSIDPSKFSTKTYSIDDGFSNNVIYGILIDEMNNFWMSTNNGIIHFNPRTEAVKNYFFEDGLQHPEFNQRSLAQTENGTFYFGGMGGLTYFDPNDFYTDTTSSTIFINRLNVNNKEVNFNVSNETEYQLDNPLYRNPSLELDHNENTISIGFSILDYNHSKSHTYQYRFSNKNKTWNDLQHNNELTLTNLSPGKYNFEVRGKNVNNQITKNTASLHIRINPPWWRTWSFLSGSVLFLFWIGYMIYENKQNQKEKIIMLRNRISQDLHDEIGSTLSSISLFGTVAKKMIQANRSGSEDMLNRINDSTTQVMESMNDIVWAINSENDKMEDLLKRMRAFASELSDVSDTKVTFNIDGRIKEASLNMVQRRNIYLIYKEAMNNAFKYAKANRIKVEIFPHLKDFQMSIEDDGIGFDVENIGSKITLGGNGLKNMIMRAEELAGDLDIDSTPGDGTRIDFRWNPKFEPNF